mmetsp:Transcript_22047/g.47952  ORF Transcript_22047/g.47952 Transcript_22047/m.47952 type:complete len:204 (-) Transcript_22047:293-904(-)
MQILLHQQQWDMVNIAHIMNRQNGISINMTKARNLILRRLPQHLPTPAKDDSRTQSHATQILHAMLRRLRLLLLPHDGNEGHERQTKVGGPHPELELTQCLQKHGGFDVAHCSSHFNEANVGHFDIFVFLSDRGSFSIDCFGFPVAVAVIVHWDVCHSFDPLLNFVGNVWYYLDCLAEIITPSFLPDDLAIHLAGGNVMIARQ